jgi:hypothetical protein
MVLVVLALAQGTAAYQQASGVSAADAGPFLGDWAIVSKGDYGEQHFTMSVKAEGEKVSLEISSGTMPVRTVTELSKHDASLVAPYEITYEGNPVPVLLTLTPTNAGLDAVFDYANGAYVESGKATKKPAAGQ